ncbi:MAG: flagellar protein FlaG [Candidatus Accumulibacter sp.]|nr:flagellar protein FlaG [Accumulibacter sp.]
MSIQATAASLPPQGNPVANNATREVGTGSAEIAAKAASLPGPASPVQLPDRKTLEAATQSVREFVKPINSNLEFSVNDDTGQLVVKIIDRTTKEVIRQMPSEEMLSIAKALDSIKGLFVQQTA